MNSEIDLTKQLEDVGVGRKQAEAHVKIMTKYVSENLVTKQDFKVSMQDIDLRFEKVYARFDSSDTL